LWARVGVHRKRAAGGLAVVHLVELLAAARFTGFQQMPRTSDRGDSIIQVLTLLYERLSCHDRFSAIHSERSSFPRC
jgi:hypothetical protein